ncbi:hypothetical protein N9242_00985 [Vicingaceae bacterium]|nr:hypothetical protein [Vicingaceae bacterium]
MSYLNFIYVKPPINLVDGVVKDETVINLGYQIETAFENIGDIFGNLYGDGDETATYARYFNSVSTSIGNISTISPEEPFGTVFQSYSQGFINNNDRKDFSMDLRPIEGEESSSISIITGDAISYVWKPTEELLLDEGDFTTSGRTLTFFKVPVGNFSAVYKGSYPTFSENNGYLPNVYPAPNLIEEGIISRPTIELMPSGRYRVTVQKVNQNIFGSSFGSELNLEFNPLIKEYLSPVGEKAVPKEFVNIWKKFPRSYERLSVINIYLLNETQFEVDTDEDIDVTSDTLVMSIANITLSEMIKDLFKLLRDHNHDSDSIIPTIDHDKLSKLIPVSDNPDITYSKSTITNNDHPEYLHREGYRLGDPATYNNAMLGTLLISSTNPSGGFANVLADSSKLSFGSVADGVSLRLDVDSNAIEDIVLSIKSPKDGLYIDTREEEGKTSKALRVNSHEIFTYGIDNGLTIDYSLGLSSRSGRTLFLDIDDPSVFSDIQTNKVFTKDMYLDGILNIPAPTGELHMGNTMWKPLVSGEVDIVGDMKYHGDVTFDLLGATDLTATNLIVEESVTLDGLDSKLNFTDDTKISSIESSANAQIVVNSESAVKFNTPITFDGVSGRTEAIAADIPNNIEAVKSRINGISFINNAESSVEEYSSLYISAQGGGEATPSTVSTFIEMHYPESSDLENNANGLWLLRSTRIPQIEKGVKYSWKSDEGKRVDNLIEWPRAKLAAGFGDFYGIKVGASNLADKQGIKFGDFNNVFVTGDGGSCPAGLMVIEALAGVAIVSSGMNAQDCSNVTYSNLIVGDIQSRGSISAEEDLTAGNNINAAEELACNNLDVRLGAQIHGSTRIFENLTIDLDFKVLGLSNFNANVVMNGDLDVSNKLNVGTLNVTGVSEFHEIARFRRLVNIDEDLNVTGKSSFINDATFNQKIIGQNVYVENIDASEITATGIVKANAGIEVAANAEIAGNLQVNSTITAIGTIITESALYANGINSSNNLSVAGISTLNGDVVTNSSVLFSGGSEETFISNLASQFTKHTTFNNGFTGGGDSAITGNLVVSGAIDADGSVSCSELSASNGDIVNNLAIGSSLTAGSGSINNDLSVGGSVSIGQQAINSVYLTVNGPITASGSGVFEGALSCTEALTFGGGSITSSGDLLLDGNITSSSGNVSFEGGSLNAAGNMIINGTFSNAGAGNIGGQLTVLGGGSFNGSVVIAGGISFQGGSVDAATGDTIFSGKMALGGALSANGGGTFSGDMVTSGAVRAGQVSQSNFNEVEISGDLEALSNLTVGDDLVVNGEGEFGKGLSCVGTIFVGNVTSQSGVFGGTSSSSSIMIGENEIKMSSSTAKIIANSIEVNEIEGDVIGSNISLPEGNDPDYIALRSQAISVTNFSTIKNVHVSNLGVFGGSIAVNNTVYAKEIRPLSSENGVNVVDLTAKVAHYAA